MNIVTDWEKLFRIIPVSNLEAFLLASIFAALVVFVIFGRKDNYQLRGLAFLQNVIVPALICWFFIGMLFFYIIKLHLYEDPVLKADPRIGELREKLHSLQEEVDRVYKQTEEIVNEYKR